jgi:carbon-monoxide dehydrogenase medium subunit
LASDARVDCAAGEEALKAPAFAYLRPRALGDVFDALVRHGDDAKLLAGGQSLVPALNMRLLEPRVIIDINRVGGLDGIAERGSGLRIGALTRLSTIGASPLVAGLAPLIHRAIPHIAHLAIRNRATIGGSLAQADPAGELPACAVALDALLHLASARGERIVAARDFFTGLYATVLAPDEVVTAVEVPGEPAGMRSILLELARRHGDYAIVGLAARAQVESGEASSHRLVFFGADVKPVEARAAATALDEGTRRDRLASAQEALASDLNPAADLQADGATKLYLARILLARAVRALSEAT